MVLQVISCILLAHFDLLQFVGQVRSTILLPCFHLALLMLAVVVLVLVPGIQSCYMWASLAFILKCIVLFLL